jgi:hypothetical protein
MLASVVHPVNESELIFVTEYGIDTEVTSEHPSKASDPISTTVYVLSSYVTFAGTTISPL